MGAPLESKAPLSESSAHIRVSGCGRSSGVCAADSARCAPVPSPSGGVVVVIAATALALPCGTKSASKANSNHLLR